MGDILKEAIADAKAVRETALENAKMALEEAFTPQLKSMLSAKLKEDDMEDEEEPEETYEDDEVGEEEPEETYEDEEFGHDKEDGEPEPEEGSYHEDEEEEEPETEEGLDLEAIIRELESELSEGEDEDEDEVEESTETSDEPVSEGEDEDEKSEEPVEEEYEIDEAALEEEEELEEVDKSSDIGKGDNNRGNTDTSSGIGKGGKLKEVQSELKEYKEAVSFLKDKLHEVNILNAKLLFTNKLFKQYSLDNNQKLKVVETFDRAQTTREIKLVYSTLAEQFGDNDSIITRKSINESASAKSGSTKPSKESSKVITEESQVANRFRKLAGILKG